MQFLIAEDNQALGTFLKRGFEADGHRITLAADGQDAIDRFLEESPEFVILDLNMPRVDGIEVLRFIRNATEEIPILVLSARNDLETRLECLDLGADECMIKPFALAELRARARALARRTRDVKLLLRHGSVEVNRMERIVSCGGQRVDLTTKEFALLEHLLLHRGRAVSRGALLERVWKAQADTNTNVVDVYVNYLRRKLSGAAEAPLIQTVRGQGYAIGLRA